MLVVELVLLIIDGVYSDAEWKASLLLLYWPLDCTVRQEILATVSFGRFIFITYLLLFKLAGFDHVLITPF